MAKLKLRPLVDDKPVRITVELPAQTHRDLVAYAKVLTRGAFFGSGSSSERTGFFIVDPFESET